MEVAEMRHEHLSERELLLLIIEKQEDIMASTTALTTAVEELTTVVGEIVGVVNNNEDQAAIDAATSAIETAITDLKGALPKPAASAPEVSSVTPTSGAAESSVEIAGTGLTGATGVEFGSNAASSYTVDSDTQITAIVPAGEGEVQVVVAGPGGSSTGVAFSYA
jgi:hypothetical protein